MGVGDTNLTNLVLSGDLTVGDDLATTGDLAVTGTLAVTGASTLTGNVAAAGTLAVTGASTLTGNVTAAGTLAVTGASTLTGNVSAGGTLAVTGASTLTGNVSAGGTLAVTGATTLTGALTANGGISCKPGTGTAVVAPAGILSMQVNQVATAADTAETDGHTYTLPANTLSANNDAVRVRIWGTTAANGNNKTLQLYFGGTSVYTTGAVAANAKDFFIEAIIVRTGAGAQTLLVSGHFNAAPIVASSRATATKDETTALVIKTTMTNGTAAAADITVNGFEVMALP